MVAINATVPDANLGGAIVRMLLQQGSQGHHHRSRPSVQLLWVVHLQCGHAVQGRGQDQVTVNLGYN